MALSMTSPISSTEIDSIDILRPGTVYLLHGLNGDKIVVKSEAANITKASFNTTKFVMNSVDTKGGASKAMSDAEKMQLKIFAEGMKDVYRFYTEHRIPGMVTPPAFDDLVANFRQNPHALWYKMPYSSLTDLGGALEKRMGGTPDKGPIKAFTAALSASGGLESLGKIIAADLFSANTDRINPTKGSTMSYGGRSFAFKTISNIGNIFLAGNGTSRSVAGMDFLDPSTQYKHYDQSLDEIRGYEEAWLGDYLVDKKKRGKFCDDIVEDLELVLCPNRKRHSPFTKLGRNADTRLEKGMIAGGKQILAALEQRYRVKAAPAGMDSRMNELRKL